MIPTDIKGWNPQRRPNRSSCYHRSIALETLRRISEKFQAMTDIHDNQTTTDDLNGGL
jgi:hypothetical protein